MNIFNESDKKIIANYKRRIWKYIGIIFIPFLVVLIVMGLSISDYAIIPYKYSLLSINISAIISIIFAITKIKKQKKKNEIIIKEFLELAQKKGFKNEFDFSKYIEELEEKDYFESLPQEQQEQYLQNKAQQQEQEKRNSIFKVDNTIGSFSFDEKNKMFKYGIYIYYYDEVKRIISDKTMSIDTKGALKGAIIGEIIDGTGGAIVGSNVGKKTTSTTKYHFLVIFKDGKTIEYIKEDMAVIEKLKDYFEENILSKN